MIKMCRPFGGGKMAVTIKDVAKALGISYSSVSRALNGKDGVGEEKRKIICEMAETMGYQPNELARGLVNKMSKTIGVIMPDVTNPFFASIVTGIMTEANKMHYDVFFSLSNWDVEREKECLIALQKKRVDGIIVRPASDKEEYPCDSKGIPLLYIGRWNTGIEASRVEIDNRKGGYIGTKHLINAGYKKIGIICGTGNAQTSNERIEGFKEALEEAGREYSPELITYSHKITVKTGYDATRRLLDNNPDIDAIFALSDHMAIGAMDYLKDKGIRFPEEIGIMGFDNISYAVLPQIKLSTVRQPKFELGQVAFQMMYDAINGKLEGEAKHIMLPPELIIRTTTR